MHNRRCNSFRFHSAGFLQEIFASCSDIPFLCSGVAGWGGFQGASHLKQVALFLGLLLLESGGAF